MFECESSRHVLDVCNVRVNFRCSIWSHQSIQPDHIAPQARTGDSYSNECHVNRRLSSFIYPPMCRCVFFRLFSTEYLGFRALWTQKLVIRLFVAHSTDATVQHRTPHKNIRQMYQYILLFRRIYQYIMLFISGDDDQATNTSPPHMWQGKCYTAYAYVITCFLQAWHIHSQRTDKPTLHKRSDGAPCIYWSMHYTCILILERKYLWY